jgi:hypothetical protein
MAPMLVPENLMTAARAWRETVQLALDHIVHTLLYSAIV